MAAHITTSTTTRSAAVDAPLSSVDVAAEHVAAGALSAAAVERVGLELEGHLVAFDAPERRPEAISISRLIAELPSLPHGSPVTQEPGGQLELSPGPAPVIAAIDTLRADRAALRDALAERGLGMAPLGADPARAVAVVNRTPRYAAMQRHWAVAGCAVAGWRMMSSTAALQVNVDAGPVHGWRERVEHLHRIGPTLLAMSACSPMLAGDVTGWCSMRQQAWNGIDRARTGRIGAGDPREAWARYALAAPVMLVHDHLTGAAQPVPSRVSFASWITGDAKLVRRPTLRDLDYHLTTLYPPVRPRGFLEIRYLDAVPDRWWPGLAAITAALADDPVAADAADEACEAVGDAWLTAARDGLADAGIWQAARRCARIAAERVPAALAGDVGRYAELVERRLTPGDELRERLAGSHPVDVLLEEARA